MSVDRDERTTERSTDPIPIADPVMGDEEKARVLEVMESGMIADGPEVRNFEEEFAAYSGADHGIATSNGTTALHATFEALGIGAGDTVLTTPFSFIASANSVRFTGADVTFGDIDPETYNLDPHAVEARLREGADVDAILAVHLYGLPAELDHLGELADEYGVPLVEDAAQSHGAEYRGRKVGSFGDAACFSFYPTKNMTTGEGGMVTTNRDDVAAGIRQYINHGRGGDDPYLHAEVGHNFRMTSIAAAIGRAQLARLPDYIDARRSNAARLTDALSGSALRAPAEPDHMRHVYHQYTVRCDDRDALMNHLDADGIGHGVYYPIPIHRQPPYEGGGDAPIAERAAEEVLSLPVHPNLSERDLDRIVDSLDRYDEL